MRAARQMDAWPHDELRYGMFPEYRAQRLRTAFALLLIIEGLMPGIAPEAWQKYLAEIVRMNPRTVRVVGVISMLSGALLLQFLIW